MNTVPVAPPPNNTPNKEPIDPQQPDVTCTHDPTKRMDHWLVVGVENVVGKAYGKATGLYNNHRQYSEQWDLWCPVRSAHTLSRYQRLAGTQKSG